MTLMSLVLCFVLNLLTGYVLTQDSETEIRTRQMPLHVPDLVQSKDLSTFEIFYAGFTHHTITYPKWFDEYPITRALFVVTSRQSDDERKSFRELLELNFLNESRIKNSMRITENLATRNAPVLLIEAAKLRLADSEEEFAVSLSEEQLSKIESSFFWMLSRNDGILATVAGNKYVYDRMSAIGSPLSPTQIGMIRALSREFHTELVTAEKVLMRKYNVIISETLPAEVRKMIKENLDFQKKPIVPQFLDVVAVDTRMFLSDVPFQSPRLNRRYSCRTATGLRLVQQKDLAIQDSECEIEVGFLFQLTNKTLRSLKLEESDIAVTTEQINVLKRELSEIDSQFAINGASEQMELFRQQNISLAIDRTIESLRRRAPNAWRSIEPNMLIWKVRCIGAEFVASLLVGPGEEQFKNELRNWLEQYDEAVHEFEGKMLQKIISILNPKQKEAVGQLFERHPKSKANVLSLMRLNSQFMFTGE